MKPNPQLTLGFMDGLVTEDILRHQMFLSNIERLMVSAMVETDMSERAATKFVQELTGLSTTTQVLERSAINAQKSRLLEFTGLSVGDDFSQALVTARVGELKRAAVDQMVRSTLAVKAHFQRIRTTAYLINERRHMGEAHAMRLAYLQNKPLLEHIFVDRAGRRWKAGHYVRTLFRGFYLELVNDLEVAELGLHGHSKAALVYPNGKTIPFGIAEAVGLPSYAEVKRLHMHPNSSGLVGVPAGMESES